MPPIVEAFAVGGLLFGVPEIIWDGGRSVKSVLFGLPLFGLLGALHGTIVPFDAQAGIVSVIRSDMYEIIHDTLAFIGGVLFSTTVILTPLIAHHMYAKLLKLLLASDSRAGSSSRGSIAALLWVAPLALVFALAVGLHKLAQIAFPTSDPHLFKRVMAWGMGLGLIGGLAIWRYIETKKREIPK